MAERRKIRLPRSGFVHHLAIKGHGVERVRENIPYFSYDTEIIVYFLI